MRKITRISLIGLIGFISLMGGKEVFALEKFGPHLACYNSAQMFAVVRQAYDQAGTTDWIPATVMVTVNDSADLLGKLLKAAAENKIWPILRLDGVPHGNRISVEEAKRFAQKLNAAVQSIYAFPQGRIYVEFANEPNMAREWGGKIEPGDYAKSLEAFISLIRPIGPIGVLNAAMNISAPDTEETMDAVKFWEQGPKGLAEELDGLAFNPYELGGGGRYSLEAWKWEHAFLGSPNKPVFLIEFGLNPTAPLGQRREFVERKYSEGYGGEVEVVTPLFCVDKDCQDIDIAVFGASGALSFLEPVGGGTCGIEPTPTLVRKCGELGRPDLEGDYEMAKCYSTRLRPEAIPYNEEEYESLLGRLICSTIGRLVPFLCRFRTNVERYAHPYSVPFAIQVTAPPEPLVEASALATGEAQLQASNPLVEFLLKVIGGLSNQEDRGFLQEYRPAAFPEVSGGKQEKIEESFYDTKKMLTAAGLQGGDKGPGVKLPEGLEPTPNPAGPTPVPGEPTPTPAPGGALWYTIDYRNPGVSVSPEKRAEVTALVKKYWPDSLIDKEWDKVYRTAVKNSWNPAFVIALWIEESGASGVTAWDLGCRYGTDARELPKNDLDKQLDCLFAKSYADPSNFEKFMCKYSEGHYPCTFEINPNFPKNLKIWYDRLVL